MKSLISAIVSVSMALPMTAFGTVISGSVAGTGSVTATSTNTGGLGGSSYQPTTFVQPVITKTEGMENNGKDGSEKQGSGSNTAMITMIAMAAVAAGTCPACAKRGTCPICIASMLGAAAAGLAGQKMDKAQGTSNTQVSDVNPVTPITTPGATPGALENTPEYQGAVKTMKGAAKSIGATVATDGTSVTLSDGSVLDPTKPNSASSYSPTPGESAMINSALAKAKDDMLKKGADGGASIAAVNEDGDGSGGAGANGGKAGASGDESMKGGTNTSLRKPSSVAGMSKDFNGDKIGVAQDSLFDMLHRRYRVHNDAKSFLPDTPK